MRGAPLFVLSYRMKNVLLIDIQCDRMKLKGGVLDGNENSKRLGPCGA